jgi:hypothetical protein
MDRFGHNRLAVFLPLKIQKARREGARVRLCVTDTRRRRHRIVFDFASVHLARTHVARMQAWARAGTEMAYVRGADENVLVDLEGLLARAA